MWHAKGVEQVVDICSFVEMRWYDVVGVVSKYWSGGGH